MPRDGHNGGAWLSMLVALPKERVDTGRSASCAGPRGCRTISAITQDLSS